jgi:hypothetical protein
VIRRREAQVAADDCVWLWLLRGMADSTPKTWMRVLLGPVGLDPEQGSYRK